MGAPTRFEIVLVTRTVLDPAGFRTSTTSPAPIFLAGLTVDPLTLILPVSHAFPATVRVGIRRTAQAHASIRTGGSLRAAGVAGVVGGESGGLGAAM